MGKDNGIWLAAKSGLALFFFFFFLLPLLNIFVHAMSVPFPDALDLVVSKKGVIWNSFLQAGLSTIFSLLIGIPAAFVVARRTFPAKKLVRALSLIPFVFPSILVVLSFVIVLGNNGVVNSFLDSTAGFRVQFLYSIAGIIIAHVFYNFPIVMRFVSAAWESADALMDESASTLGADKISVFLNVTLPQLVPAIIASASLVFIYCFMSFAIVLSLGGVGFGTLEVQIYYLVSRALDLSSGAVLAGVQFVMLAALALAYLSISSKYAIKREVSSRRAKNLSVGSLQGIAELAVVAAIILFIAVPLLSLAAFAFISPSTGEFSLRAFEKIFSASPSVAGTTPISSIFLSVAIAVGASVIATLLGLLAALRRSGLSAVSVLLGSSLAVSVITLGFGYLITYGSGSVLLIAIGHSVFAFPFAFRAIKNALDEIDGQSIDAARALGANYMDVLKYVQLPRIRNAVFVSLAFCFAVSLGELGLVLMLYDGVYATMPVYIYRLISTFDLFAATAMGLILISVSLACFYVIEALSQERAVF